MVTVKSGTWDVTAATGSGAGMTCLTMTGNAQEERDCWDMREESGLAATGELRGS
jgi:hypothetical protein